jgi:hypothetical protein
MSEAELEAIRDAARRRGMTVSEYVRVAVREARRSEAGGDPDHKLAAIRSAQRYTFPTADIDQMLAEIELGYGESSDR